ncbi:unnamed protein product, partial [marine sediment metagenome]
MNGGIFHGDFFKGATLIEASNEDSNYPVANLINGKPGEPFKTDDTASFDSTLIEITLAEAKGVQNIYLGAHNLNDGDTIKLHGYTEGNQFVTPAHTLGLELEWVDRTVYAKIGGELVQLTVAALNGGFRNIYKNLPATKTYKYWSLELSSDHQIIVGVAFAGLTHQFTKNYNLPVEELFETSGVCDHINGQIYEDQSYERRGKGLDFVSAPWSDFATFKMLWRQGYQVLIPDMAEKECFH